MSAATVINSIPKPYDKFVLAGGWGLAAYYAYKTVSGPLLSLIDSAKAQYNKDRSKAHKMFVCADEGAGNSDGKLSKAEFEAASKTDAGKALDMDTLFTEFADIWDTLGEEITEEQFKEQYALAAAAVRKKSKMF